MRGSLIVMMYLSFCGCSSVSEKLFTEDEICSLCCKFCGDDWKNSSFQCIDATDAKYFVGRMFRDRDFFTPKTFKESYDLVNMTRKLSCGEARGLYAKTDVYEIYLYVDLVKQTFADPEGGDYCYYPFDYWVYNIISNGIDHVASGSVDDLQLWQNRNGYW